MKKSFVLLAGVAFLSAHVCFAGVIQFKQSNEEQKRDLWDLGVPIPMAMAPLPIVSLDDTPIDDGTEHSGTIPGSDDGDYFHK